MLSSEVLALRKKKKKKKKHEKLFFQVLIKKKNLLIFPLQKQSIFGQNLANVKTKIIFLSNIY